MLSHHSMPGSMWAFMDNFIPIVETTVPGLALGLRVVCHRAWGCRGGITQHDATLYLLCQESLSTSGMFGLCTLVPLLPVSIGYGQGKRRTRCEAARATFHVKVHVVNGVATAALSLLLSA